MEKRDGQSHHLLPTTAGHPEAHGVHKASLAALTLGAIGVVYGDIGTSPLYALRECISGPHGMTPDPDGKVVYGVLSLFFWSLILVVTVKYIVFVMRAHNDGEGGIFSLLALVPDRVRKKKPGKVGTVAILVILGAGLLYGDGMITPAVSVLSAAEGLAVADERLHHAVMPFALAVLVGIFAFQSKGTAAVGKLFGPVMVIWFLVIGGLGAYYLAHNPKILAATSPVHAIALFQHDPWHAFRILGSVVLCVTGGEALYADMGHFGARPIRRAWLALVLPALLLAYFGQGVLVLEDPTRAANPFFAMVPRGIATYLLVALATAATIIASQALISGAFSLTHQAVQLGYFPRVTITHTAREHEGQIYVPEINWMLAFGCVLLVVAFQSSSKLAAAYGIAVTGTMAITTIMFFIVAVWTWRWPILPTLLLVLVFLIIDLAFFGANALKFAHGGYVPIVIAFVFFLVMVTWRIGRSLLGEYMQKHALDWKEFLDNLEGMLHTRVPGTAVFMASPNAGVPPAMAHQARLMRVLPERVLLLTIQFHHVPYMKKLEVEEIGSGFWRVIGHCGFMQSPVAPEFVRQALQRLALPEKPSEVVYYLGRETFLATNKGKMGKWSESLFSFLSKNARTATAYFSVPPEQVIELGTQIDL